MSPRAFLQRRWIMAAAVCCVIGAVALHRHATRPPTYFGFIVGLVAVDTRSAVVVWRANGSVPSTSWVTRIDAQGEPQWVQPIPAVVLSAGADGPVTVVDGVVVVRYAHRGASYEAVDNSAIAFDLADGHVLWDRVLTAYTPYEYDDGGTSELRSLPTYISDLGVGERLVSYADPGSPREEVATSTDIHTGVAGWTHPVPTSHFAPVTFGDTYATQDLRTMILTDARSGAHSVHRDAGPGCVVGAEYVVLEREGHVRRLVAYASATSKPRVIAPSFTAFGREAYVLSCGVYLDRLVFLVRDYSDETHTDAVITGADGTLIHRIPLSNGEGIIEDASNKDPIHATFGGELPRFVLYPTSEKHERSLVMVDLETGTIAWRGAPDSTLLYGSLFHHGTRWIWVDSHYAEPTIAVFNGNTGRLQGAIAAYSDHGVLDLGRASTHIATQDTLWLYAGDWSTPEDAALASIDLATLQPRYAHTIRLTDATSAVRQRLGL